MKISENNKAVGADNADGLVLSMRMGIRSILGGAGRLPKVVYTRLKVGRRSHAFAVISIITGTMVCTDELIRTGESVARQ
ncbi:hypothetical protein DF196_00315 [Bifidobacterium callitrichidarum]|uniref:Uncharacterized protein n=1 Tax=Bifidobacterium callitrichidarum TaxID=2052941 RepID=A0A2U2NCX3_9BIFI|nr:hypothetical protein DF196_00315 [Bifidobacterium callitrichidarum]